MVLKQARFAAIVEALSGEPGVTHAQPGSKVFGHFTLKVHDKIFAMISSSGHFVVKLAKPRVDALKGLSGTHVVHSLSW